MSVTKSLEADRESITKKTENRDECGSKITLMSVETPSESEKPIEILEILFFYLDGFSSLDKT